jgi:hypothetical protein
MRAPRLATIRRIGPRVISARWRKKGSNRKRRSIETLQKRPSGGPGGALSSWVRADQAPDSAGLG